MNTKKKQLKSEEKPLKKTTFREYEKKTNHKSEQKRKNERSKIAEITCQVALEANANPQKHNSTSCSSSFIIGRMYVYVY